MNGTLNITQIGFTPFSLFLFLSSSLFPPSSSLFERTRSASARRRQCRGGGASRRCRQCRRYMVVRSVGRDQHVKSPFSSMRLVESFLAVYYTSQVLFIRQLPTNFSAITVGACNRPQPLLACDANPGVNFSLGSGTERNPPGFRR